MKSQDINEMSQHISFSKENYHSFTIFLAFTPKSFSSVSAIPC